MLSKLLLLGFAAFMVTVFGVMGFVMLKTDPTCAYGSFDRPSNTTISCKPRPKPTANQAAAVRAPDFGRAALTAFRRTEDAGEQLIGFGFNKWGESTISIPVAADGFFAKKQRHLHFKANGKPAETSNEEERKYVLVNGAKAELFDLGDVRPAAVIKAIKRVESRERGLRFKQATLSGSARFGVSGLGWSIEFEGGSGFPAVQLNAKGKGMCALNAAFAGLKPCAFGVDERDPEAASTPANLPSGASQDALATCVEAAGTNPLELAQCATEVE